MLINLELDQGEWFQYFGSRIDSSTGDVIYDEPATDARVKVRPMGPFIEERVANRQRQTEHVLNPKTRQMERVTYYPELSAAELRAERGDVWDYAIQDWEGFKDARTGQAIKCTRENKIALMKLPVFDRFIARCQQLLAESGVQEAKEEEKNSSTGSSSAKTKPDPESNTTTERS
jgi:hypothetical protein